MCVVAHARQQRLAGATLLVFANKQDLSGSMTLEEIRQVSRFIPLTRMAADGTSLQALQLDLIQSHKWLIYPCSAYSGQGLSAGLDWVVKQVAGRLYWSGLQPAAASNIPGLDEPSPPAPPQAGAVAASS